MFQLPDFTRVVWRSPTEQAWWQAKLARIRTAWDVIERESVAAGLRAMAYQIVVPEALPSLTRWAVRNGLTLLPVSRTAASGNYVVADAPPTPNQPWKYRVAIVRSDLADTALTALEAKDPEHLGELLGYPACCREHFMRTWHQGQVDSTWEAYRGNAECPSEMNLFLRWLGVRPVPHMACSAECLPSLDLALDLADLGRRLPYGDVIDEMYEMLAWPITWSRAHGLAEIITPAAKIVTRSDYTPTLQRLARSGVYLAPTSTLWTDNGFTGPTYMLEAHSMLLNACWPFLKPGDRVLDLGAGNGRLLALLRQYLQIVPTGVEVKPIVPVQMMDWVQADIATTAGMDIWGDAVLLMPGRISELPDWRQAEIRDRCLGTPTLIVYAYGDNLKKAGGLAKLTAAAGLPDPTILTQSDEIAVGVIRKV